MTSKRLYGLDFLKIFAILWICLYHFLDFRNGWQLGSLFDEGKLVDYFSVSGAWSVVPKLIISMGGIGVHLFIIASGMGLALSIRGGDLKLKEFFKKRVFRILPHYWLLLAGVLFVKIFQGDIINYFDFLAHFLGIHTFFPGLIYSISTPLWFIGVILQLYLLFPIIYKLIAFQPKHTFVIPREGEDDEESHESTCKHSRLRTSDVGYVSGKSGLIIDLIIILLIIITQILLNTFFVQLFNGGRFFTEFIVSFCTGIYLGNLVHLGQMKFNLRKSALLITMGIIGMAVLLLKAKLQIPSDIIGLIFSLVSIAIFVGIFSICHPEFSSGSTCLQAKGFLGQARNDKRDYKTKGLLIFLSTIAYPLYLTHYFVFTHIFSKFDRLSWIIELSLFLLIAFIMAFVLDYVAKKVIRLIV